MLMRLAKYKDIGELQMIRKDFLPLIVTVKILLPKRMEM